MKLMQRRITPQIQIGNIFMGSDHPVVIQSMTNTPTADINATVTQISELIEAGSELVRLTVNDDAAAQAIPAIIQQLRDQGHETPIIGDFHYNGHLLLAKHPKCAQALAKYRINPGNVGKGEKHDDNFATIIKIAIEHDKPVRIGVNWGSLDQELLSEKMDANAKSKKPKDIKEVIYSAMIQSAIDSSATAEKLGLARDRIILSVKMSHLQDMVNVYSQLARYCDYALHLGLTEAGSHLQGAVSSSAALAILLQQGIGDTIRVSLTPQAGVPRAQEVNVAKTLLQSLGLRYFEPTVTSCPGCGRTSSHAFEKLADDVKKYIQHNITSWRVRYPGVERLNIAVMGCVVNGPGESRHADIGISLPGSTENPVAPVYADGKQIALLKGKTIKEDFLNLLEHYIMEKYK